MVSELNEAQERVVNELGASAEHRPVFPDGLAVGLRHQLTTELDESAKLLSDDPLFVSKRFLSHVHGCEVRHLDDLRRDFAWSVPAARGTIAHKAIEFSVNWRTTPLAQELVDQALATLANDGSPISSYLREIPESERAELRSEATNSVQAFLDGFPPLREKPHWRPSVESRGRHELHDGAIVLYGKVDLTLGAPEGDRSGRVIIDIKGGRRSPTHVDDLRFYALIETLRFGTAPRTVASYYLDESRLVTEHITTEVLWAASERAIAGIQRHVDLSSRGAEPKYRASIACHWCPLLAQCDTGSEFLQTSAEDDDADPGMGDHSG